MTQISHDQLAQQSELGKRSDYDKHYNPERLLAIPRLDKRRELGIDSDPAKLPFFGFDLWNHYEVSWLNNKGKPCVGVAEIWYDCSSPYLVESKSLKLYFNSLNNSRFPDTDAVCNLVRMDLEQRLQTPVHVRIFKLDDASRAHAQIQSLPGICIDDLDIVCDTYQVQPDFLNVHPSIEVSETYVSHLLKSNCLITNQPDWGSVMIAYSGKQIAKEGLLRYIVSFRDHNEFHEQCIERIFMDILQHCNPSQLSVYGRYTRRGGLDINPYRSTELIIDAKTHIGNLRLCRQ